MPGLMFDPETPDPVVQSASAFLPEEIFISD
jgi:hypothetical protein